MLGRIDRDGEAQTLARKHGRVHADHLAGGVDERAARVARVDRRVGLNDVVHQAAGLRTQRTAQRAHHACGTV